MAAKVAPNFTAAQAAQKKASAGVTTAGFFTAAQAAQKCPPGSFIRETVFTAAQAAQKHGLMVSEAA
tara:strand:+ start:11159 stop:11359 length:201 start_codon:yes stop_codon:yes gene_type:complete